MHKKIRAALQEALVNRRITGKPECAGINLATISFNGLADQPEISHL